MENNKRFKNEKKKMGEALKLTESCSVIPEASHLINLRENYNIRTAICAAICCPPDEPPNHAERVMLCTAGHSVTLTIQMPENSRETKAWAFPADESKL
jgi:hypothetical protein